MSTIEHREYKRKMGRLTWPVVWITWAGLVGIGVATSTKDGVVNWPILAIWSACGAVCPAVIFLYARQVILVTPSHFEYRGVIRTETIAWSDVRELQFHTKDNWYFELVGADRNVTFGFDFIGLTEVARTISSATGLPWPPEAERYFEGRRQKGNP